MFLLLLCGQWEHAYIDAYYYAITTLTTVGYGDRTPNTDGEKIYSILTELAGERHRHTHTQGPHLAGPLMACSSGCPVDMV